MLSRTELRHAICRLRCAAVFSCLGSAALLESCERFEVREVLATVLAVEGKATIVHEAKAIPLAPLSLLAVGDHVRSERAGKVTISLVPGARVVLNQDSEIAVEELQIHKLGAAVSHPVRARNAWIGLLRGSIYASVVKSEVRPHIRLYVDTPAGTVEGSPESVFYVRVDGIVTHVVCAGGAVNLLNAEGENAETLNAGYAQEWQGERSTGSPTRVVRDVSAAEEDRNALAAARASEELEDSRRYIIPGLDHP